MEPSRPGIERKSLSRIWQPKALGSPQMVWLVILNKTSFQPLASVVGIVLGTPYQVRTWVQFIPTPGLLSVSHSKIAFWLTHTLATLLQKIGNKATSLFPDCRSTGQNRPGPAMARE